MKFDAKDEKRDAVALQISYIGNAAAKVSNEFKIHHPEIAWSSIMGTRNRIFHEDQQINSNMVWDVAIEEVPALIVQIEPLVPPEEAV